MPATANRPTLNPAPDKRLDLLHSFFPILVKAFGDTIPGKKAKRLQTIVPCLQVSVCALFDGDVEFLAEVTIVGKVVDEDVAFELVRIRGDKEAQPDDFSSILLKLTWVSETLTNLEGCTKLSRTSGIGSI